MSKATASFREFPGLSHHAFQHPLDSQALAALRRVPALPTVLKFFSEKFGERFDETRLMSQNLRVGIRQYPSLHKKFVRMAQVLDVRKLPSLYIETSPTINAYATGMENYSIILCSGILDVMEDEELLAILGHELGHVKCEHMLYKTLAHHMASSSAMMLVPAVPFLKSAVSTGLGLALWEWNRKAELSCDRAALLATQDIDVVASALTKLAGFSKRYAHELNLDAVEEQADEHVELGQNSLLLNIVMLNSLLGQSHPYPVVRVKEIRHYAASLEYARILKGEYQREQGKLVDGSWAGMTVGTPRFRLCKKDNYPCDEDYVFCPNCQSNVRGLKLHCTACKQPVEAEWAHCMQCGAKLTTDQLDVDEWLADEQS